jgi:hypothetical protein
MGFMPPCGFWESLCARSVNPKTIQQNGVRVPCCALDATVTAGSERTTKMTKDLIDYIQELLLRISSLEGIIEDLRKEVSSMKERESNRTYS